MEQKAASGANPAAVLEELDNLRWIDGIGYHTWRLCHYLGAGAGEFPTSDSREIPNCETKEFV